MHLRPRRSEIPREPLTHKLRKITPLRLGLKFRKVQQYTLITAMKMGNPGIWSLVLGLLSTECIIK